MESFESSLLPAPFADSTLAAASFAAPLETASFATPFAAQLSSPSCGCKFFFNNFL